MNHPYPSDLQNYYYLTTWYQKELNNIFVVGQIILISIFIPLLGCLPNLLYLVMTHGGYHIKNLLGGSVLVLKDASRAVLNYIIPNYIYVVIKD